MKTKFLSTIGAFLLLGAAANSHAAAEERHVFNSFDGEDLLTFVANADLDAIKGLLSSITFKGMKFGPKILLRSAMEKGTTDEIRDLIVKAGIDSADPQVMEDLLSDTGIKWPTPNDSIVNLSKDPQTEDAIPFGDVVRIESGSLEWGEMVLKAAQKNDYRAIELLLPKALSLEDLESYLDLFKVTWSHKVILKKQLLDALNIAVTMGHAKVVKRMLEVNLYRSQHARLLEVAMNNDNKEITRLFRKSISAQSGLGW